MLHTLRFLVVIALVASGEATSAGWFSDKNFYVIEQNSPSGKYIDGWIIQGMPKNANGVYVFTIYGTKIEKRIPIQGTVVTKIGPKWDDASKMISARIRASSDSPGKYKGF